MCACLLIPLAQSVCTTSLTFCCLPMASPNPPHLTGTRHPFMATYKVGFTNQGKVTALEVDLYNNAGGFLMFCLLLLTDSCAD